MPKGYGGENYSDQDVQLLLGALGGKRSSRTQRVRSSVAKPKTSHDTTETHSQTGAYDDRNEA
jgi:hypothetical protein